MGKAAKRKRKVSVPSAAKGPVKLAMAMVKSNPFEVKVNRQKFNILGRKTKNDVGLPGVSRSKAIKKVRGHLGVRRKDGICRCSCGRDRW